MSVGIKILYDWILQSNRPARAKAGTSVFVIVLVFCFLLLDVDFYKSAIVSLTTTAITAIVVEYTQKKYGFIFGWPDALATVLPPGLITAFLILVVTL